MNSALQPYIELFDNHKASLQKDSSTASLNMRMLASLRGSWDRGKCLHELGEILDCSADKAGRIWQEIKKEV